MALSAFMDTGSNKMSNPLIQIDDEVREMTDEEYQALLDSGWTPEAESPTDE